MAEIEKAIVEELETPDAEEVDELVAHCAELRRHPGPQAWC